MRGRLVDGHCSPTSAMFARALERSRLAYIDDVRQN